VPVIGSSGPGPALYLPVKIRQSFPEGQLAEPHQCQFPSSKSMGFEQCGIRNVPLHLVSQVRHITLYEEGPIPSVGEGIPAAGDIGSDDRYAHGSGFDQHIPESLAVRSEYEQVDQGVCGQHVQQFSQVKNPWIMIELRTVSGGEGIPIIQWTHQQEQEARMAFLQFIEGTEQQVDAFVATEATHESDHETALRQSRPFRKAF
jgi:hypothetical protein